MTVERAYRALAAHLKHDIEGLELLSSLFSNFQGHSPGRERVIITPEDGYYSWRRLKHSEASWVSQVLVPTSEVNLWVEIGELHSKVQRRLWRLYEDSQV